MNQSVNAGAADSHAALALKRPALQSYKRQPVNLSLTQTVFQHIDQSVSQPSNQWNCDSVMSPSTYQTHGCLYLVSHIGILWVNAASKQALASGPCKQHLYVKELFIRLMDSLSKLCKNAEPCNIELTCLSVEGSNCICRPASNRRHIQAHSITGLSLIHHLHRKSYLAALLKHI